MNLKRDILLLLICVSSLSSTAQLRYNYGKYKSGEYLKFDVYYNWGFIWLNAGWAEFEIKDTVYNHNPSFHFYSTGATNSGYDWFFKVRDTYETISEPYEYRPYWFRCNTLEGGYYDKEEVIFNYTDSIAIAQTENSKQPLLTDTIRINSSVTDILSAIYKCRSVDFSTIKKDEKLPVPVIVGNKLYNLYFRYLGKETIENRTNKKYNCRKFSVMMVSGTIFNGGEDLTVWMTDDEKNIPILVQAKILVGSIKAYLSLYEENVKDKTEND